MSQRNISENLISNLDEIVRIGEARSNFGMVIMVVPPELLDNFDLRNTVKRINADLHKGITFEEAIKDFKVPENCEIKFFPPDFQKINMEAVEATKKRFSEKYSNGN